MSYSDFDRVHDAISECAEAFGALQSENERLEADLAEKEEEIENLREYISRLESAEKETA